MSKTKSPEQIKIEELECAIEKAREDSNRFVNDAFTQMRRAEAQRDAYRDAYRDALEIALRWRAK